MLPDWFWAFEDVFLAKLDFLWMSFLHADTTDRLIEKGSLFMLLLGSRSI